MTFTEIHIPIYKVDILFTRASTEDEYREVAAEYERQHRLLYPDAKESSHTSLADRVVDVFAETSSSYGAFVQVFADEKRHLPILCRVSPKARLSTFVHESVHIASEIMDYVGIRWDRQNDEPIAYLIQAIYERLVEASEKLTPLTTDPK
jgi:hypothetical protein